MCQDEALFTVIISPRHLAHSMDKMTRANGNGDFRASKRVKIINLKGSMSNRRAAKREKLAFNVV